MGSRAASGLAAVMALAEGDVTGLAVVRDAMKRRRGVMYFMFGGVGVVWFGLVWCVVLCVGEEIVLMVDGEREVLGAAHREFICTLGAQVVF